MFQDNLIKYIFFFVLLIFWRYYFIISIILIYGIKIRINMFELRFFIHINCDTPNPKGHFFFPICLKFGIKQPFYYKGI